MSVIGIDFGNESCYVGVARAGGIETVDNDYSLRATSSTVAFGEKQRILGVAAKNQLVTNIKNTVWGFKRFLGRPFLDPYVQEEIKRMPFEVVNNIGNDGVAVRVNYMGKKETFAVEQLTAMLFTKLKETSENTLGTVVGDCVISVPSYFTEHERRALRVAARTAGLNVLRFFNETAATSLTYGIYKQDLPEADDKPRNVIFVDCGHSALQVWACAFNKGKLKILASTADAYLGGRDFDKVLADHFCAEFKEKYKIDTLSNHRAYVRLLTEVEKLKKQMSANATKLPLNIECLMDDKDVTSTMCRADFEHMSAPLLERVDATLKKCLNDCKLELNDIYSVEIVGGSSRIPAIKQLIEKVFGKVPSTTLNQDEAVARGCALQCAILSPSYKVRDFKITDCQPYPIRMIWDESIGPDGYLEVFPQYHPVPFTRTVTFFKREDLRIKVVYSSLQYPYPISDICNVVVKNNAKLPESGAVKIKVKVRVNMDGIFSISNATAYEKMEAAEELMETEPISQESSGNGPQEANENSATTEAVSNGPQESSTETQTANSDDVQMGQDESGENEKKKVILKPVELNYETSLAFGFEEMDIHLMNEDEGKMIAEDRREKERIDVKNSLEEWIYMFRDKLDGDFSQFCEENFKVGLKKILEETEEWLYDAGSDEPRAEYAQRLRRLQDDTAPIVNRFKEFHERPIATEEFGKSILLTRKVIDMKKENDPRYAHFDDNDITFLSQAVNDAEKYVQTIREGQAALRLTEDPPVKAEDIRREKKAFEDKVQPTLNKPKPKEPEPKKQEETVAADAANMNANHEQTPQNMEVE